MAALCRPLQLKTVVSGRGSGDSSKRLPPRSGAALTSVGVRGNFFSARQAWKNQDPRRQIWSVLWRLEASYSKPDVPGNVPLAVGPPLQATSDMFCPCSPSNSGRIDVQLQVVSCLAQPANGSTPQTAEMRANPSFKLSTNGMSHWPSSAGPAAHFALAVQRATPSVPA